MVIEKVFEVRITGEVEPGKGNIKEQEELEKAVDEMGMAIRAMLESELYPLNVSVFENEYTDIWEE